MSNNPVNSIDPNGGQDQPRRIYDGNGKDVTNHYYNSKGEFIGWNLMTSDYDGSRARAELRNAAMNSGDAASSSAAQLSVTREDFVLAAHIHMNYKAAYLVQSSDVVKYLYQYNIWDVANTLNGQGGYSPIMIKQTLMVADKVHKLPHFDYSTGSYEKPIGSFSHNSVGVEKNGGFAQSGGGVDPFGVALGVGELAFQGNTYNNFGSTVKEIEKLVDKGKYLHNGEVYYKGNYKGVTNSMKSSLSASALIRNVAKTFEAVGILYSLYEYGTSNGTPADKARLMGAAGIYATSYIPRVGPFVSVGLGIYDSFGGFDKYYESFNH